MAFRQRLELTASRRLESGVAIISELLDITGNLMERETARGHSVLGREQEMTGATG